jgi:hypothetical protein
MDRCEGRLSPPAATVSSATIPTPTGPITATGLGRRARVVVATEARLVVGAAPEHPHRHDSRHNGHTDANESHHPDQGEVGYGGQDSSQRPESRASLLGLDSLVYS